MTPLRLPLLIAWCFAGALSCHAVTAGSGVISGSVSNAATRNLLPGARVEIPALALAALADDTGRYALGGVPAGSHEMLVTYIGLDAVRRTVALGAGGRLSQDFELTTAIYRMDQFKVVGEREGDAAAITAQRNADNVRNVVAADSFGNLPNLNAAEVAIRLPGIAGNPDDGGTYTGFTIRGMGPGLNSVTLDGGPLTGQGGMARNTMLNNFSGTMLEQIELIKGHTPDKGADSLGGTLNLRSRSPLSLREPRRTTYSLNLRTAPSFTEQIPAREGHRVHPVFNVAHQQVFDVPGGERNLGVSLNLFYSENVVAYFSTVRDFENTTREPAYLWDYRTTDFYANRKQWSLNLKAEHRLSAATRLRLNAIYNDTNVSDRRTHELRAYTSQTVGTTGTAGILPGYTNRITEVRPAAASIVEITAGMVTTWNRLRHIDAGAEHTFGRWHLDWGARYSQTRINSGNGGEAATLTHRLAGVGWILDRTASDLYPRLIQTAGPDFTNPANYRPAPAGLVNANTGNNIGVGEAFGDARLTLPTAQPLSLKAGFKLRETRADDESAARRWNYVGASGLPADSSIRTLAERKAGLRLPRWEAAAFIRARSPVEAAAWREDLYYRLNVVQLTIPPLRERRGYIPALSRHLLSRIAKQPGLRDLGITDAAMELLVSYDWPGNVRQLQNVLFRAAVLCEGDALTIGDFPQVASKTAPRSIPDAANTNQDSGVTLFLSDGHMRPLDDIEADIIRLAIGHYRGRMTEVARRLGIGRSTLYRKLAELGISEVA